MTHRLSPMPRAARVPNAELGFQRTRARGACLLATSVRQSVGLNPVLVPVSGETRNVLRISIFSGQLASSPGRLRSTSCRLVGDSARENQVCSHFTSALSLIMVLKPSAGQRSVSRNSPPT